MKTLKLTLAVLALICSALGGAMAAQKNQEIKQVPVGIPYSLEYMAKHSPTGKAQGYFGSKVTFYESGYTPTVYRTFDWNVLFYQNGSLMYYFSTNGSMSSWTSVDSSNERWTGDTVTPDAGTYTVVVQNISGVGGFYEGGVFFTDANGQGNSVWVSDTETSRRDMTFENVYVNGTDGIDIQINKTSF